MIHHRTVDRIAQLLELIAAHAEGMTLSELANELKAPVSSIQGLMNGLVATGYSERIGSRYQLGPAPYILTLQTNRSPARVVGHQDLEQLAIEGNYTVLLGIRMGDDIVYIDEAGNHPVLQYLARTRVRHQLMTSPAGKVMLAALHDDELHEYLRRHPQQDAVHEFLEELPTIRTRGAVVGISVGIPPRVGYPVDKTGVVAAAVRDHDDRVIGTVVLGQDLEYFNEHAGRMVEVVLRHTEHWASRRGSDDPVPPPGPEVSVDCAGAKEEDAVVCTE